MKKKIELIIKSIPNMIIFSFLGIIFSLALIPMKLKEYFSFIKQMHKDVWYSELRWDLCDKYGGCEWGELENLYNNPKTKLKQQTCKFCKNIQYAS